MYNPKATPGRNFGGDTKLPLDIFLNKRLIDCMNLNLDGGIALSLEPLWHNRVIQRPVRIRKNGQRLVKVMSF